MFLPFTHTGPGVVLGVRSLMATVLMTMMNLKMIMMVICMDIATMRTLIMMHLTAGMMAMIMIISHIPNNSHLFSCLHNFLCG